MAKPDLPYITAYPSKDVRAQILDSGFDLYQNLVNTWLLILAKYRALLSPSPALRSFLESYLIQSASTLSPSTTSPLASHEAAVASLSNPDTLLRAAVLALLMAHPLDDPSKLVFLEALEYPALLAFIRSYAPSNLSLVRKSLNTLYTIRGGRPFVNSLTAAFLADPPTTLDARLLVAAILPASPLLAKDWVSAKWFFALESLYVDADDETKRAIIETAAASLLLPLSILDSNAKIKVLSDVISKASSGQHYHLLAAMLNHTNFSSLVGVPSLTVTLETARLRLPKEHSPADATKVITSNNTVSTKQNTQSIAPTSQEKQAIESLRDLFPQLSEKATLQVLRNHNGSSEDSTAYLLEHPDELDRLAAQLDSESSVPPSVPTNGSSSSSSQKLPPHIPTGPAATSRSVFKDDLAKLATQDSQKQHLIFGKRAFELGRADSSTLESTLMRIYQADEDEHDDTYDDAEETTAASASGAAAGASARAVEPVAGDDGAQIVASRRNKRKDKQVSKEPSPQPAPSEETGDSKKPAADAVEKILWERYERGPGEFSVSARRTRARTELRTQTGWTNEQIEGWARMLERMPQRKERLAERYMFRGNALSIRPTAYRARNGAEAADAPQAAEELPRQPRAGSANNSSKTPEQVRRDQARKEKQKARTGNHNRKAGHARKMDRAGAFS